MFPRPAGSWAIPGSNSIKSEEIINSMGLRGCWTVSPALEAPTAAEADVSGNYYIGTP